MYQEKDKYRLLIKNLPDGLAYCKIVRDSTGKPVDYIFLEVNSSFEALTGIPRENVIGKKVTELYPGIKDLSFDWIGIFGQVADIATGQSIRLQHYFDQQERWYEITAYSDQPGYLVVVFHDITENKKAEEELRQREKNFSTLVENAPDMIVRFNLDLQHIYCNKAVEHQFGAPIHRFIGKTFLEIDGPPEQLKSMHQLLKKALKTGKEQQTEQSFPLPSGQKYFQTRIVPERDEKGRIESLLAVTRDITERKQAEEGALRESEERYRTLFERTANPILIIDAEGNYLSGNETALQFLECTREELLLKNVRDTLPPGEQATEVMRKIMPLWESGGRTEREYYVNGKIKVLDLTISPCMWNGKRAIFGLGTDITERKQAEIALRKSERNLAAIMNASMESILLMDLEGGLLAANESLAQRLGTDLETLLRGNFYEFLPSDVAKNRKLDVKQVIKSGKPIYFEDESFGRTILNSFYPIFNSKGQINRLAVIGMDITERKKMEERELYSKQVLLAIRKVNQLIVQETDPDCLIDHSCQILTETLGYYNAWIALLDEGNKVTSTAASGFDKGFNLLEEKLKQGKYPPCMNKALEDEGIAIIDNLLDNCPDCPLSAGPAGRAGLSGRIQYGDKLYGILSVSIPSEYANLKETSKLFIELAGDLGLALYKIALEEERKQAEEKLFETKEYLENLIKYANAPIIVWDTSLSITRFNQAFEDLSGYDASEVIGKKIDILFSKNKVESALEHIHKTSSGERWEAVEIEIQRKDGEPRIVLWNAANILDAERNNVIATIAQGQDITERKQAEEELKLSYQKLQNAMKSTIQAIALILEKRDPYTAGHQKRVTKLACAIAEEISLPKDKIEGLYIAGIIHDIGKINVPTEILSKPGKLSEIELSLIKTHSQVGSDILKEMELPGEVSAIVLQHHERMDGSGYPSGLSGKDIILEARILEVADVVEAMASHRPYRPALGLDKALEEITQNKGKLYDPEVVDACLNLFKEKGFKFE